MPETFSADATNRDGELFDEEQLYYAMRNLPVQQRRAIEMIKLREMSLKEASAETGMSIGNLKILVHRAIKGLRKTMRHRHG